MIYSKAPDTVSMMAFILHEQDWIVGSIQESLCLERTAIALVRNCCGKTAKNAIQQLTHGIFVGPEIYFYLREEYILFTRSKYLIVLKQNIFLYPYRIFV